MHRDPSNVQRLSMYRWASVLLSVICVLGLLTMRGTPAWVHMWHGEFTNPDTYYLFDVITAYRSHHPFGLMPSIMETGGSWIHWSHAYPGVVDFMARVLTALGLSSDHGLYVAVTAVGILSWMAVVILVPLAVDGRRVYLGGLLVFLSVVAGTLTWQLYSSPIGGSHHMLMVALMAYAWVAFFRGWNAYGTGVACAAAIWVSPEVFPLILLLMTAMVVRAGGIGYAMRTAGTLLVLINILVLLDPGPVKYGPWMPDHVSLAYVVLFALVMGAVSLVWVCGTGWFPWVRGLMVCLAAVIWVAVVPGIAQGVHGIIPADMYDAWYSTVSEIQPTYHWPNVLLIVQDILGLVFGTVYLIRSRRDEDRVLLAGAWVYMILSLLHLRTVIFCSLLVGLVIVRGYQRAVQARTFMVWAPILLGLFLCISMRGSVIGDTILYHTRTCSLIDAAPDLQLLIKDGDRGWVVYPDLVPELLWVTRGHPLVLTAGPYHRDHDAMRLYYWVAKDHDPFTFAQSVIQSRHLRYIVACPEDTPLHHHGIYHHLMDALQHDQPPAWLHRIPVRGGLMVYTPTE